MLASSAPSHVIKNLFGHRKVGYRGLAKNAARAKVHAALANLYIAKRRCRPWELVRPQPQDRAIVALEARADSLQRSHLAAMTAWARSARHAAADVALFSAL